VEPTQPHASLMRSAARQRAHHANLAAHRRTLGFEVLASIGVAIALVEVVPLMELAAADLQIGFSIAAFLFGCGVILFVHHASEVLDLECPRCSEPFHGDGVEQTASPFRRHCAHCGLPSSPRRVEAGASH